MCDNPTTNPAQIAISPNSIVNSSCNAHASFFQQVILSFNPDLSEPFVTFEGSGEGVPMRAIPPSGTKVLSGNASTVFAQFSFSANGAPFQLAKRVCSANSDPFIYLFCEDSGDNDDNDSYLSIFLQSAPSGSNYK